MRTLATKQPTNDSAKLKKKRDKRRSHSVSPLSTGMPLLQRICACGGGCPRCQEESLLQTKLKIGEPGDKYEQEADRVADRLMRIPEPKLQRQVEPEAKEKLQGQPIEEKEERDNSCEVLINPVKLLDLKQFGKTNLIWTAQIRTTTFGIGILSVRSTVSEVLEEPQIKVKEIISASKLMTVDCDSKCNINKDPKHDNVATVDIFKHQGIEGNVSVQIRTTNKSLSQISTELTASANWSSSKFQSQKVVKSKCGSK